MNKIALLENQRVSEIVRASFVFFCTLLIFYLDAFIGGKISYYIFYFPTIAAMAWYFGRIAGWSSVIFCTALWFIKQWDVEAEGFQVVSFWNGFICCASFCAVCWMILAVREGQSKLKQRSQELEAFAFKAAHELNSPTMNILGYAELLEEQFPQDEDSGAKRLLTSIVKNVKRMKSLIQELLEYATVGKPDAGMAPVDLGGVLKETLELLSPTIAEKKAEVLVDPLPSVVIEPGLAGLLFQNLIGNAIKYCEKEPRIRISTVRKRKEWVFSIQDNGIGIPKESLERVFVIFEKLASRQKYPGSGIGLAICQKIVERYGGRIWVESKLGEGSTFFFTLPCK